MANGSSIQSLGVWIDHRLGFKAQAAAVNTTTRRLAGILRSISERRGATLGSLHHLGTMTAIPAMRWESKIWWTGALHVFTQEQSAYKPLAQSSGDFRGLRRCTWG